MSKTSRPAKHFERLYRANPYENTKLFNDDVERNTVYSRVDTLAQRNRLVGFPWAALKDRKSVV